MVLIAIPYIDYRPTDLYKNFKLILIMIALYRKNFSMQSKYDLHIIYNVKNLFTFISCALGEQIQMSPVSKGKNIKV